MLTRKHFKRAAEKLAAAEITVAERARLAKLLAEIFAEENERFNRKLFFRAAFMVNGATEEDELNFLRNLGLEV